MSTEPRVVVIVARKAPSVALLRWVRWFLPAAMLIVSPTPLVRADSDGVITLVADAVDSSPLAVADAIVRAKGG